MFRNLKNLASFACVGALLISCSCKKCDIDSCGTSVVSEGPGSASDFQQNVPNTVYFGFDRYDLTKEAKASLDKVVGWLKMYTNRNVSIAGHTDKRGTQEYNLALGSRRAESAKTYLVQSGVEETRISTISYGKESLVSDGETEEAHALNRRAQVSVVE